MKSKKELTLEFTSIVTRLIDSGTVKSKRDIVDKLGWDETAMSNVMAGRRNVPLEIYNLLVKLYNIEKHSLPNTKPIPVYALDATAGNMPDIASGQFPEKIEGYINIPSFKECIAFLYVRGDSMYPRLKAGDLIGLIPVLDTGIIQFGQVYLIVTTDNQRMVKYIRKSKSNDEIILRSENDRYDDIELHKSKVLQLYRVKGPVRDDWQ